MNRPNKNSQDPDDYFVCPHCGAELPANASFCRECGASEDCGWGEDNYFGDQDTSDGHQSDDDFDYDEYIRREFPAHAERSTSQRWIVSAIIILLCLSLLMWTIL